MFQKLKDAQLLDCKVHVIQPIPQGRVAQLAENRDGYHVILQGIEDGKPVTQVTKVNVLSSWINPYLTSGTIKTLASDRNNVVVVSNTTESGIEYEENDRIEMDPPSSFPAKLTQFLFHRFHQFAEEEVFILPCELIDKNGEKLKFCVEQYAALWRLDERFQKFLDNKVYFYNTLVDRIVTGFPKDPKEGVVSSIAASDPNTVVAEPYHLWVIEGSKKLEQLIPFGKSDLNVLYTDNLKAHREVKVRVLNGIHSCLVPLGISLGLKEVRQCIKHPSIIRFVEMMIKDEIIVGLEEDFSRDYLTAYAEKIVERLLNPFVSHQLADISLNHLSKVQTRILPGIKACHMRVGHFPPLSVFAIASTFYLYSSPLFEINEMDAKAKQDCINARFNLQQHDDLSRYFDELLRSDIFLEEHKGLLKAIKKDVVSFMVQMKELGMLSALNSVLDADAAYNESVRILVGS